jgi:hypothetical protein
MLDGTAAGWTMLVWAALVWEIPVWATFDPVPVIPVAPALRVGFPAMLLEVPGVAATPLRVRSHAATLA